MKKLEQIKLDNFKEQYRVLLRDIQEVNSELEVAIKSRDVVQNELEICKKELKEAKINLSQTIAQTTEVDKASDNKRKESEEREKESKLYSEQTRKAIEKSLIKHDKEVSILVNSIVLLNKDLSDLQQTRKELTEVIRSETKQQVFLVKTNKDLDRSLNKKKDELKGVEKEIEQKKSGSEKDIERLKVQLKKVEKEIEKEQTKYGLAEGNLKLKEKEIERKENDIRIHTRRLNELYQKIRPGIRLKI